MSHKLPTDAFDVYFSLGADRSYKAVAERYGVSKTTVVNRATKEGWQKRVERLEVKARATSDQKNAESQEQMNTRHLKAMRVIQGKALETLKAMSLDSAMNAVRALDLSVKGERLVRGEPTDRTALSVEHAIKREVDRWMAIAEVEEEELDDDEEDHESSTDNAE